jgi:cyclophilin family peptidyl-prolyl cis-trans isomerase
MTRLLQFIAAILLLTSSLRAQDGIFADFSTSMGNFTCQLHYDRAPRTVANFIGLATGTRAWMDIPTGDAKRTPFFDGLTFHRVVSGFVIQGGSPNGSGTDGPGYTFKDEFHPTLRHDQAGVLSMANSGLHSNGSQFFVTLAATSHLDDVHSIFGNVTSGMAVVQAIGSVSVDGAGKPIVPVVMNGVTIRRVGTAALAFDVNAHGLPTVGGAAPVLTKTMAGLFLQFNRSAANDYWVYYGPDLKTWARARFGIYISSPGPGDIDVSATAAGQQRFFYRVPQISYPPPLHTPPGIAGSTLTLNTTDIGTLTYVINAAGTSATCTWSGNGSTGAVTSASWIQEAYRGRFGATQTNFSPIQVDCAFTTAGSGIFKGVRALPPPANGSTPMSGTFTFTMP